MTQKFIEVPEVGIFEWNITELSFHPEDASKLSIHCRVSIGARFCIHTLHLMYPNPYLEKNGFSVLIDESLIHNKVQIIVGLSRLIAAKVRDGVVLFEPEGGDTGVFINPITWLIGPKCFSTN